MNATKKAIQKYIQMIMMIIRNWLKYYHTNISCTDFNRKCQDYVPVKMEYHGT